MNLIKFYLMKQLLYGLAFKKSYAKELKLINTIVIKLKMETRSMKVKILINLMKFQNQLLVMTSKEFYNLMITNFIMGSRIENHFYLKINKIQIWL